MVHRVGIGPYIALISSILLGAAGALYIAAGIITDYIHFNDSITPNTNTVNTVPIGSHSLGAFIWCDHYSANTNTDPPTAAITYCNPIDTNCNYLRTDSYGLSVISELIECNEYNSMRALLIIASVFSIVSCIMMLIGAFTISNSAKYSSIILGLSSSTVGLSSYLLFTHYKSTVFDQYIFSLGADNGAANTGISLLLATIAWPLALVGTIIHSILICFDRKQLLESQQQSQQSQQSQSQSKD